MDGWHRSKSVDSYVKVVGEGARGGLLREDDEVLGDLDPVDEELPGRPALQRPQRGHHHLGPPSKLDQVLLGVADLHEVGRKGVPPRVLE